MGGYFRLKTNSAEKEKKKKKKLLSNQVDTDWR
jgi:hypothetical protein